MWYLFEDQLADTITRLRESSQEPHPAIEAFIENLRSDEFPEQETIAALPKKAFAIFERIVKTWTGEEDDPEGCPDLAELYDDHMTKEALGPLHYL
jgi:hypothetical protein